jgi:hypothetical protein
VVVAETPTLRSLCSEALLHKNAAAKCCNAQLRRWQSESLDRINTMRRLHSEGGKVWRAALHNLAV